MIHFNNKTTFLMDMNDKDKETFLGYVNLDETEF